MITSIMLRIAKIALGKKILEIIALANSKASGHRSELIVGCIVIVAGLQHLNLLDSTTAGTVITALLGALPVTVAEKTKKALDQADSVIK